MGERHKANGAANKEGWTDINVAARGVSRTFAQGTLQVPVHRDSQLHLSYRHGCLPDPY